MSVPTIYSGFNNLDLNLQIPTFNQWNYPRTFAGRMSQQFPLNNLNTNQFSNQATSPLNQLASTGIGTAGNVLSGIASDKIFGDSEMGRVFGTLMGSATGTTTNTLADNLLKGISLTEGLGKNMGSSLAGAGAGVAANYLGKGITSAMGNSAVGKALGAGVSSTLGTIGGQAAGNLAKFGKIGSIFGKGAGSINPIGLAATAIGSALGAGLGESKEYGGEYGKITQFSDMAYDTATAAVNAIPVAGQLISGLMALNKGISNVFGSTDGMTVQDAILGSPLAGLLSGIGAPLKWLNMWGAQTTGTFNNQSWQNSEKTKSFMGNAFGDLQEKFDKAKKEAGKTYGTFSKRAKLRAQENIDFANQAWDKVLKMADQNEIQNIRSQLMSSINNQRYAQDIQGGFNPLARGKLGMKILNNATNHKIGMRLLSGAALVDSKQMILCSAVG